MAAAAVTLVFAVAFASLAAGQTLYTAYHDTTTGKWSVASGSDGIATGFFVEQENTSLSGWNILDIETDGKSADALQAYAAGFLEGYLTYSEIWDSYLTYSFGNNNTVDPALIAYLDKNVAWINQMVASPPDGESAYWTHVGLVLQQYDGLYAGYMAAAPAALEITSQQFWLYELQNELGDIQQVADIMAGRPPRATDVRPNRYGSHCSALVKATADGKYLFAGHDTWSSYNIMLRIYKHLTMNFISVSTPAPKVSYSTVPGFIPSGDDFYITSQNIMVTETTNDVFNNSLYAGVNGYQVVFYFVRNTVANRMATSAAEWMQLFSMYNNGGYNNQWIVVDYKLWSPRAPLQDNTLWIGEQLPGYFISADQTDALRQTGYWASYNVPYFPFVYGVSGYEQMYQQYGDRYSYSKCPRAQIFARDQHTVADLGTMQKIMRYNQWQTDPLSLGDACESIAARCDLNAADPDPFGAVDSKITEAALAKTRSAWVVNGPTWDSQPVFSWDPKFESTPHYGQPNTFQYTFYEQTPSCISCTVRAERSSG